MELDKNCFEYYERFISEKESNILFRYLKNNIDWEEREIILFGKTHKQPRLICWMGDLDYKYSGETMKKKEFNIEVRKLKEKIEKKINSEFNSVLLNYYRDGNDSMGRHSDNEKELGFNPTIASLTFGSERTFVLRNKISKEVIKIDLKNGSLLVMKNDCQKIYEHELPKTKKEFKGRINLTFRKIIG